jgi:GxxExxY protein
MVGFSELRIRSRGGAEGAETKSEGFMRELDEITDAIIAAAIQIHRDLGPGLLESVYETLLAHALEKRGFHVQRQVMIRIEYDGIVFDEGFRTDLIVEHEVIVELKSVEKLAPVFAKKLLTYLRLANKRRAAPEFRSKHSHRGPAARREQSPALRVSAAPREPKALSRPPSA